MNKILETATTKLGNKIELIGESGENNVLVIGVFHGDEPQGKYLIEQYLDIIQSPSPYPSPQCGEGIHSHNYTSFASMKSKELRKNPTDAENIMWQILRKNQIHNLHFKRQQPIGKYIVDFVCLKRKIVIEIDGGQHNEPNNKENDSETKYLNKLGYKVLRLWNNDIIENLEGVVEYLQNSLAPLGRGIGRGALLFIPCLNPDGLQQNTRTNANGVDLNRNFPTQNWGVNEGENATCDDETTLYYGGKSPASETETKFVIDIIKKYNPKVILTLHAPYKVVNYDGPAEKIAQKISDIIKYPVEKSIGYPTPGSFGTYCGIERNIPTVTLELDEEIPVEELFEPISEIFEYLKNTSY